MNFQVWIKHDNYNYFRKLHGLNNFKDVKVPCRGSQQHLFAHSSLFGSDSHGPNFQLCKLLTVQWRLSELSSEKKTQPSHFENPTVCSHLTLKQARLNISAQYCVILLQSFVLADLWLWLCPCKAAQLAPALLTSWAALTRVSQMCGYMLTVNAQELAFLRGNLKAIQAALNWSSGFCKPQYYYILVSYLLYENVTIGTCFFFPNWASLYLNGSLL